MKKTMRGLFLAGTVVSLTACEKVIDIPLEDADRKFVVEAVMRDNAGDNYVLISKTGSVYATGDFEKISTATVTVQDQAGNSYNFLPVAGEPGKYRNDSFTVSTDNLYSLKVLTDTDTFTSTSQTFYKPQLDSLSYLETVGSFGVGTDTTYLVFFSFFDNGNQENYYRVAVSVNGVADGNYYITNDELFNGQNYSQPAFATTVEKGDTVLVELLSMDKKAYSYFFSLANATTEGPFAPTPSNPVSNINGGAIGYFAAYTTDTMSIIIPQ